MQGSDCFTYEEALEIRRLLREKLLADRNTQKALRARLRALGFYITDFQTDQSGFTEADFNQLVERGTVKIAGHAGNRQSESELSPTVGSAHISADRSQQDAGSARRRRNAAAAKYRPSRIRMLLVAEAPPKELRRYFYFDDVREHDLLFRYVVRGVLGTEPKRTNKSLLLSRLKEEGIFLVDLMEDPKNRDDHKVHVERLVARCEALRPDAIILIKAPVYDAAFRQMKTAKLPVVDERVPFPGSGQQRRFEEAFRRAVQKAGITPLPK